MTDNSRKTPPLGNKGRPVRAQSHDDRDLQGFAARQRRELETATVSGVIDAHDEITGKYEGDELDDRRARRPTPERIRRIEHRQDQFADKLDVSIKDVRDELKGEVAQVRYDVRSEVAQVRGEMTTVSGNVALLAGHVSDLREDVGGLIATVSGQKPLLNEVLGLVKQTLERDHITVTAKVDVDKAHELSKIEIEKERELAKVKLEREHNLAMVEVDKEQKLDTVEARKVRRKALAKLFGSIGVAGYALWELLQRLGVF